MAAGRWAAYISSSIRHQTEVPIRAVTWAGKDLTRVFSQKLHQKPWRLCRQWPFQQDLTSGTSRIHHFIETLDSPAAKEMGCHNKYILAKCLDSWWGVPVCVHTWGDNSSNHLDCLLPAPLVDSLQQLEPQGHAHPATAPFVVTCYPGPHCHCNVVPSYFLWWSR